jgi:hypothetical protein
LEIRVDLNGILSINVGQSTGSLFEPFLLDFSSNKHLEDAIKKCEGLEIIHVIHGQISTI